MRMRRMMTMDEGVKRDNKRGGRNSFVKVAHIYVLRMVEKKDKREEGV